MTEGIVMIDNKDKIITDLLARVIVMQQALEMHMEWIGPPPTSPECYDSPREDAWALGKQALSAAPKVVWQGDGWVFINSDVEFRIDDHYLAESDLLLPVEDGEAVWITVTKKPKLEEEDGQAVD